jgi:hypothetical protein
MSEIQIFISSLFEILTDENVVGKDNLESDFGIQVGENGEQQLKSRLLDESSKIFSNLSDYSSEIRENSTPLYSGYCSFESFTNELELHLMGIDDGYFLLSYSSNEDVQIEIFDNLEDSLESCSNFLSNRINYFEIELSNYEENKEYYEDSKSNGYGMSLEMKWNFPLSEYLYEKSIISKERLKEIESILEKVDSF